MNDNKPNETDWKNSALKIVRESVPYIIVPVVLALLSFAFAPWYLAAFFVVVALFMAYFFRDPKRTTPEGADLVVAPADGRVTLPADTSGTRFRLVTFR